MDSAQAAQPYLQSAGDQTQNAYGQVNNAHDIAGGGLPYLGAGYGNIAQGADVINNAQNPLHYGQGLIGYGAQSISDAQSYLPMSAAMTQGAAQGVGNIGAGDITQYMNPYQQNVIQATLANMAEDNAQQQQQVQGNAAMRGALGGDRVGVAQSELARQQALANNQTLAGMNAQNYQQATQTALSQQQNQQANQARMLQAANQFGGLGATQAGIGTQLAGAGNAMAGAAGQQAGIGNLLAGTGLQYGSLAGQQSGIGSQLGGLGALSGNLANQYGNIGLQSQMAGIQGGQSLMGAGTMSQQNQQALDTANYQQYLQQLAFPYQQSQFLAGIGLPAAGAMGGYQTQIGTSNQTLTPPGMSLAQGIVGGGALLGGLFGGGGQQQSASGGRVDGFASGGATDDEDTPHTYRSIERALEKAIIPKMSPIMISETRPNMSGMAPMASIPQATPSALGSAGSLAGIAGAGKGIASGLGSLFGSGAADAGAAGAGALGAGELVGALGGGAAGAGALAGAVGAGEAAVGGAELLPLLLLNRGGRAGYADGGSIDFSGLPGGGKSLPITNPLAFAGSRSATGHLPYPSSAQQVFSISPDTGVLRLSAPDTLPPDTSGIGIPRLSAPDTLPAGSGVDMGIGSPSGEGMVAGRRLIDLDFPNPGGFDLPQPSSGSLGSASIGPANLAGSSARFDVGGGVTEEIGANPYNLNRIRGVVPNMQVYQTPKVNTGQLMHIKPMMDIAKAASAVPGINSQQMQNLGTAASRLMTINGGDSNDEDHAAGGRIQSFPTGGPVRWPFDPNNRFPYPPPIPQTFPAPFTFPPGGFPRLSAPDTLPPIQRDDIPGDGIAGIVADLPAGAGGGGPDGGGLGGTGDLTGGGNLGRGDLGGEEGTPDNGLGLNGWGGRDITDMSIGAPTQSANQPDFNSPSTPTPDESGRDEDGMNAIDIDMGNDAVAAALADAIANTSAPMTANDLTGTGAVIDINGNSLANDAGLNDIGSTAAANSLGLNDVGSLAASNNTGDKGDNSDAGKDGVTDTGLGLNGPGSPGGFNAAFDAVSDDGIGGNVGGMTAEGLAGLSANAGALADAAAAMGAPAGYGGMNADAAANGQAMDAGFGGFDVGNAAVGDVGAIADAGFGGNDAAAGAAAAAAAADAAGDVGGDGAGGDGAGGGGDGAGGGEYTGGRIRRRAFGGPVYPQYALQGYEDGGDVDDSEALREVLRGQALGALSSGIPQTEQAYPGPTPDERTLGKAALMERLVGPEAAAEVSPASFQERLGGFGAAPMPRPRPAEAPSRDEAELPAAATPTMQINPYAAAAQQAAPSASGNPAQTGWGEIMNARSPMYQNAVPQRKSPREMFFSPRGLTEFGARVLAANPAHGWGSAIGQGALGTLGTFDKFADEDLSARQKAQNLAAQIKKHAETLGEHVRHNTASEGLARDRLEQDNWKFIGQTVSGAPIRMNVKDGSTINAMTGEPLSPEEKMALKSAAANNPAVRYEFYKRLFPENEQYAALLASGRKMVSPGEAYLKGQSLARQSWDAMMPTERPKGMSRESYIEAQAQETVKKIQQLNFMAGNTGGAQQPAAQEGDTTKAIPLPSNPSPANLKVGQRYQTAAGEGTWNGKSFDK